MGSSPLSRGILHHWRRGGLSRGIIPALAGNTDSGPPDQGWHGDHPRSRGEYQRGHVSSCHPDGSSPLSRGIRHQGCIHGWCPGIIPALAGNTLMAPVVGDDARDHPRSRGEYHHRCREGWSHLRIIPALAGNTRDAATRKLVTGDHPRSRGEYLRLLMSRPRSAGSSPLSRGIPLEARLATAGPRIIPALAGNTVAAGRRPTTTGDHPRSRGEYGISPSSSLLMVGSSPLSRGIPTLTWEPDATWRIIPALAGNTTGMCSTTCQTWDHPRSRGEYPF